MWCSRTRVRLLVTIFALSALVCGTALAAEVKVPLVLGMQAQDAKQTLKKAGLKANFELGKAAAIDDQAFRAYEQAPAAGATAAAGSEVRITIFARPAAGAGKKAPARAVPKLAGKTARQVKAELESLGLSAKFQLGEPARSPAEAFNVYQQVPAPGTKLAAGGEVTLTIYAPAAAGPANPAAASAPGELSLVAAVPDLSSDQETIDPQSGRLMLSAVDLVEPAGTMSITVRRTLVHHHAQAGLLGTHWRLNLEKRLVYDATTAVIEEGVGGTILQKQPEQRVYRSAAGDLLTLVPAGAVRLKSDLSKELFDRQGRLVQWVDPNGNRITFSYENDRLARVAGPFGRWVKFTTNAAGRLTRCESSSGAVVQYGFDPQQPLPQGAVRYAYNRQGLLVEIDRSGLGATRFDYDWQERVAKRVWPNEGEEYYNYQPDGTVRHTNTAGQVTTYKYAEGRREVTDPLGRTHVFLTDKNGHVRQITTPNGEQYTFEFDDLGRLVAATSPGNRTRRYEYLGDTQVLSAQVAADGTRTTYQYDAVVNLVAVRVGDQVVRELTYDRAGLPASVKSWDGTVWQFTYDQAGRIASAADAAGHKTEYAYDQRGNLTARMDPLGNRETRAYDAHGRLTLITDADGNKTAYHYDAYGRLTGMDDAGGGQLKFQYDSGGRILSQTDRDGVTTRSTYDPRGRVSRIEDDAGNFIAYAYDLAGNVVRVDSTDGEWTFAYNEENQLTAETGPLGHRRQIEYGPSGHVFAVIDALGRRTEFAYDKVGRLTTVRDAAGNENRLEYDADGKVISRQDALGRKIDYAYDQYGRVSGISQAAKSLIKFSYQGATANKVTGPAGTQVQFERDKTGQVSGLQYPNGERFQFERDPLGRIVAAADGLGHTWKAEYSPTGLLRKFSGPLGKGYQYQYNPLGQLAGITDPLGHARQLEYDAAGRLARLIDPLKRRTEYNYDRQGQLTGFRLADGSTLKRDFDALGRLANIQTSQGPATQIEYDAVGHILREVRGDEHAEYEYSALDRVTEARYKPADKTVRYGYDQAGRRTWMELEGIGRWKYEYDPHDRLVRLTDPEGGETQFEYDEADRVVARQFPNGVRETRQFDSRGRLLSLAVRTADSTSLLDRKYEHDAAGNLVRETRDGKELAYTYDSEDRLVAIAGLHKQAISYDAAGNLLPPSGRAKYDVADQLVEFEDERFQYDARGALVSRSKGQTPTKYEHDVLGRLTAVRQGDQLIAEYGYDTRGRRTWKRVGGKLTRYLYDGLQVLAELDEQGNVLRWWTHGPELDRPIGFHAGEASRYLTSDLVSSIVAVTDAQGQITSRWDYEPFGANRTGAQLAQAGELPLCGFAGGVYDAETGLYYFRSRYYDPRLGRFLTPDPELGRLTNPASLHRYQYAYNNPLRYSDPTGATAAEIADGLTTLAGRAGAWVGDRVGELAWTVQNPVKTAQGYYQGGQTQRQMEQERTHFATNVGILGDTLAATATTIVTDPLRFGSGFGEASVEFEQAAQKWPTDKMGATLHAGSGALQSLGDFARAVPLLKGANALRRGVVALNAPVPRPSGPPSAQMAQEFVSAAESNGFGGFRWKADLYAWLHGKKVNWSNFMDDLRAADFSKMTASEAVRTGGGFGGKIGDRLVMSVHEGLRKVPIIGEWLHGQAIHHELLHGIQHHLWTVDESKIGFIGRQIYEVAPSLLGDPGLKIGGGAALFTSVFGGVYGAQKYGPDFVDWLTRIGRGAGDLSWQDSLGDLTQFLDEDDLQRARDALDKLAATEAREADRVLTAREAEARRRAIAAAQQAAAEQAARQQAINNWVNAINQWNQWNRAQGGYWPGSGGSGGGGGYWKNGHWHDASGRDR